MAEDGDRLDPDAVHDLASFFAFVKAMAADRRHSRAAEMVAPNSPYGPESGGWENITIEDFLEAALSWAEDAGKVEGRGLPAEPTWRAFATFLYAGKVYE